MRLSRHTPHSPQSRIGSSSAGTPAAPADGATADARWLPLFPLHAVLFPGGLLPLKIFEARYIDMVSQCLKDHTAFGVALIRAGQETGAVASVEPVGCSAHIVQWDRAENGLLLIQAEGGSRFRLVEARIRGQLLEARIDTLTEPGPSALPAQYLTCATTLRLVLENLEQRGTSNGATRRCARPLQFADAGWVADRWCEILPIPLQARQKLLELADPQSRLAIVDRYLHQHRIL
jgi:Lon protease-like protein